MEFGEKLLALRKKERMSQEDLAEKLNTSRQAISKWENGQGYPETEKILMISNLFDVSLDYLLKDSVEHKEERKDGYYVSKETAEGFLNNEKKLYKNTFLGLSIIISAYIPYLLFKDRFELYVIIISIMVAVGIGMLTRGQVLEDNYKIIRKEYLVFDEKVLKNIKERYCDIEKKYSTLSIIGVCLLASGMVILFFLIKGEATGIDTTGYQIVCTFLMGLGICIVGYFSSIIESYKILAKNEEYTNKLEFRMMKKIKNKFL